MHKGKRLHPAPKDSAVEDERSEGDRREPERSSSSTAAAPASAPLPPDPEVPSDRPKRRRFTAEYKKRILAEHDACSLPGEIGALLRREGLYSSLISEWKRQRDEGADAALAPRQRGRKAKVVDALAVKVAELERDKRKLEERLRRAELIIDVQKKVSQLLGIPLATDPETGGDER